MTQFMAGWQMGQGRNENQRRNQELEMERARQQALMEQRAQEFELRKEEYAAQKKALAAAEAKDKVNAAKEAYELRSKAQSLQWLPSPTAQEVGIQQTTPQDVGPTLDQINVPQPMMDIPNPQEGQAPIPMPVLTGPQQQMLAQEEEQRKMRALLGMESIKHRAAEPYKVADDERAAALARERDRVSESRTIAREQRTEGKQSLAQENRLRAEYNRESKKLRDGLNDLDRFTAPVRKSAEAGKPPSAADQFALIYAFNKALDPSSVVRESEFKNTQGVGAGVADQAYLMLKKWRNGEQLAPAQITQMMDTISRARAASEEALGGIRSRYSELAAGYGLDSTKIVDKGGESGGGTPKATHRWSPRGGIIPIGGK